MQFGKGFVVHVGKRTSDGGIRERKRGGGGWPDRDLTKKDFAGFFRWWQIRTFNAYSSLVKCAGGKDAKPAIDN